MSGAPAQQVYPIFLTNLGGAPVVVIGGGQVAARKVAGLLAAQAAVTVISPTLAPDLALLAAGAQIGWFERPYAAGDLDGARLVFAATNVRAVNAQVADDAAQRGILCNVADAPGEGTFHLPAVHRQAEVVIAVGTSGTAPGRARQLRDRIAGWLAVELATHASQTNGDRGHPPRSPHKHPSG